MTESALRCCFAHLMRILRLDRLRLRVPPGIRQNWHSVDGQLSAPPNNSSKFRTCSVNEFFVLHFSVCPLLNGYLVHVEPAQIGVIEINTINDVRFVARNYVAVTSERSFRLDLRKKVLLESTTGRLTNSRRLLVFLHGHIFGVVSIDSVQRFSANYFSSKSSTAFLKFCAFMRVLLVCVVS